MATDTKEVKATAPAPDQRERYAFALFSERSARGMLSNKGAEQVAAHCFRDADTFLAVSQQIRSGELVVEHPVGPQLSDVSAPNLDPTHPHNLVSKRFGDLGKVREINARLVANPTLESLPDMRWGKPEVSLARAILPAYAEPALAASN